MERGTPKRPGRKEDRRTIIHSGFHRLIYLTLSGITRQGHDHLTAQCALALACPDFADCRQSIHHCDRRSALATTDVAVSEGVE